MFKQFAIVSVLGASALVGNAFAATASGTFNVAVNLTPKCEVVSGSEAATTIGDLEVNYTAFQTTAGTAATTFNVRCTSSMKYSLSVNGTGSYTDATTNLGYTLNLGTSAENATSPLLSDITGVGTNQTYAVKATFAAGQSGTATTTNGTVVEGSNAHSVTITY